MKEGHIRCVIGPGFTIPGRGCGSHGHTTYFTGEDLPGPRPALKSDRGEVLTKSQGGR